MTDYVIDANSASNLVLSDGDRVSLLAGVVYSGQLIGASTAGVRIAIEIEGTLAGNGNFPSAIYLTADDPLSPGHIVAVREGGIVDSHVGVVIRASDSWVQNFGLITDSDDSGPVAQRLGIGIQGDAAKVWNDGVIDLRSGPELRGEAIGIAIVGSDARIVNTGEIASATTGVGLLGDSGELANTGLIRSRTGIEVSGDGNTIFNAGEVRVAPSEGSAALSVEGDGNLIVSGGLLSGNTGLAIDGTGNIFVNTGLIRATDHGVWQDPSMAGNGDWGVDGLRMYNGGQIVTTGSGWAIDLEGARIGIQNDGLLLGVDGGVRLIGDQVFLRNTGEIEVSPGSDGPAVYLDGAKNVVFRNLGEVTGDVVLGDGDDIYRGRERNLGPDGQRTSGTVDGVIYLGGGNDLALGGRGQETIYGGDGDDYFVGHQGDDTFFGGDGNDRLNGGDGNDVLTGGPGDDVFEYRHFEDHDRITDFGDGADQLNLNILGEFDEADVLAASVNTAGGVLIDLGLLGSDGTILLEGLTVDDLTWDFVM